MQNKFLTEAEENGSINDLYSLANEQDKGDDFEIEFRPGEDTRCLHYCSVAPFCEAKNV